MGRIGLFEVIHPSQTLRQRVAFCLELGISANHQIRLACFSNCSTARACLRSSASYRCNKASPISTHKPFPLKANSPPESFSLSSIRSLSRHVEHPDTAPQQHLDSPSVSSSSFRLPSCLARPSNVAAVRKNADAEGEGRGVGMRESKPVDSLDVRMDKVDMADVPDGGGEYEED